MIDDAREPKEDVIRALAVQMTALSPAAKAMQELAMSPAVTNLMHTLSRHEEQTKRIIAASGFQELSQAAARYQEMSRRLLGPVEDLKRIHALGELEKISQIASTLQAQFRMPVLEEIHRTIVGSTPRLSTYLQQIDGSGILPRAMEAVRTPWIDRDLPMRSLRGFADLQAIGHAVKVLPPFTEELSSLLRGALGDWRDKIDWPPAIFDDAIERAGLYAQLGLDFALTEFPAPAFARGLELAELGPMPPDLVALYGEPVHTHDDDELEAGFARTNKAHDWLQRLEHLLRRCIEALMTELHGPDWPRHRLPNGMYEQWADKQRRETNLGRAAQSLIAYADFTDYVQIIQRGDNWREVFKPVFGREQDIRESLQRLLPIRICTMHARVITQEDELLLYVEARRISNALSKAI